MDVCETGEGGRGSVQVREGTFPRCKLNRDTRR